MNFVFDSFQSAKLRCAESHMYPASFYNLKDTFCPGLRCSAVERFGSERMQSLLCPSPLQNRFISTFALTFSEIHPCLERY